MCVHSYSDQTPFQTALEEGFGLALGGNSMMGMWVMLHHSCEWWPPQVVFMWVPPLM